MEVTSGAALRWIGTRKENWPEPARSVKKKYESGAASGLCRPLHIVAQSTVCAWLKMEFWVALLRVKTGHAKLAPEPGRVGRKKSCGAVSVCPSWAIVVRRTRLTPG
jgi:hypothetical protein